ncbi:hypothetical protein [Haloferax sp. DFSO60]|uniref:hypothetical protein n=1 Tax=Haloferax sp. DFSO60 TaxID=3388652 RepID=UPI00397E1BD9
MSSSSNFVPLRASRRVRLAAAIFLALILFYSVVIVQQILLGVMVVFWIVALWYGARLIVAIEGIATQLGRVADSNTVQEETKSLKSSRD